MWTRARRLGRSSSSQQGQSQQRQGQQGQSMSTVKAVNVDIGGTNYLIASDDNYLDAFANGFEPAMVELFRAVASDTDVILDVGANIGCTALLFASMAKKVYAFEP